MQSTELMLPEAAAKNFYLAFFEDVKIEGFKK